MTEIWPQQEKSSILRRCASGAAWIVASVLARRCLAWLVVIAGCASLILAATLTPFVGESQIDIGLDLLDPVESVSVSGDGIAPVLEWGSGPGDRCVMERLSPQFSRTPDLVAERIRVFRLRMPPRKPLARYYGQIPRRALGGFDLHLTELDRATIVRVYVAALRPVVYFRGRRFPSAAWGQFHEQWQPVVVEDRTRFACPSPLEQGGKATFGAIFLAFLLLSAITMVGVWLAVVITRDLLVRALPERELKPFRLWPAALFTALLAGVWLFYLACYYPGVMTPDSIDQWGQAHSLKFKDMHPAFHTMTICALTKLWDSPASVALAQIALLAGSLGYGFSLLLRAGVPRRAVALALAAAMLSPRNGMMAVTLWKDSLYTAALFGLTALTALCVLDRRAARRRRLWIAVGLALGLCPLYRHNGIVVLLGMIPAFALVSHECGKSAFVAILTGISVFGGVKYGLYAAVKVEPADGFFEQYTDRASLLVGQDAPLSEAECRFLDRVAPFFRDNLFNWNWALRPSMIIYERDLSFVERNVDEYRRICVSLLTRYPYVLSCHMLRRVSYLYWPPQPGNDRIYTYYNTIVPAMNGLKTNSWLPDSRAMINDLLLKTADKEWSWLFWRPAMGLWLVLFAAAILSWRTREWRLLVVFMPSVLNTLSLFLAAASQESRYQFPLTFATGWLICFAFLPVRQQSSNVARPLAVQSPRSCDNADPN